MRDLFYFQRQLSRRQIPFRWGCCWVMLLGATAGHCWGCCCAAGVAAAAGGAGRDFSFLMWDLFYDQRQLFRLQEACHCGCCCCCEFAADAACCCCGLLLELLLRCWGCRWSNGKTPDPTASTPAAQQQPQQWPASSINRPSDRPLVA